MTPSEIIHFLNVAKLANRPIFVHMDPGAGRFNALIEAAQNAGIWTNYYHLDSMEIGDFEGHLVPTIDGRSLRVLPPIADADATGIIFFEVSNHTPPKLMLVVNRLALLHEYENTQLDIKYKLSPDVTVVLIGHKTFSPDLTILNKFISIDVE